MLDVRIRALPPEHRRPGHRAEEVALWRPFSQERSRLEAGATKRRRCRAEGRGATFKPRSRDDSNSERSAFGYLDSGATMGSPICLLYSAVSEGEQYISRMSNPRGCKRRGNLLRACQGCVYILGSSIVTVSSMLS